MNKYTSCLFISLIAAASFNVALAEEYKPVFIPSTDAESVARKIWMNECAGTVAGLTAWNQGEDFASLGICHFIWYPRNQTGPFCESFPDVIAFFLQRGVTIPDWLIANRNCPWVSREEFLQQQQSFQMIELRNLLENTISLQAEFVALRLQKSLPLIVSKFPVDKREQMIKSFYLLVGCSKGLYAILDYLNFKGEGLLPTEAYQGEGWGLIQVLAKMKESETEDQALQAYVDAAKEVLERRVANSPVERNEKRWLKGWLNRVATYLK